MEPEQEAVDEAPVVEGMVTAVATSGGGEAVATVLGPTAPTENESVVVATVVQVVQGAQMAQAAQLAREKTWTWQCGIQGVGVEVRRQFMLAKAAMAKAAQAKARRVRAKAMWPNEGKFACWVWGGGQGMRRSLEPLTGQWTAS